MLAGSFERLSGAARQLLARLHPANFGAFASIVVAAMLRAAAMGEAFLEESLSGLAEKDPSRFQQLNQRLTVREQVQPAGLQRGGFACRCRRCQPTAAVIRSRRVNVTCLLPACSSF